MDIVKEYIENIAVYTVLTGFIAIILPNNSYRKYIYLVIGIIFLAMIAQPLKRGLI